MTLREAQLWGGERLAEVEELRDTAAWDASLLLRSVLGIARAETLAWPERVLTVEQQAAYEHAIARRASCEPVQYITGQAEFWGMTLRVTPAVLIPRPETEVLVEEVLSELRGTSPEPGRVLRILDVGTGSGAIAIALARELPGAEVTAVDLSAAALAVAQANATRYGVNGRLRFVKSDLMEGLAGGEVYDAIVSNPPYVPEGDRGAMHPQVREYEPALALFAGDTGLGVFRRLVPAAWRYLRLEGLLAMELGFGQREAVRSLLQGWNTVRFAADLQGIPRVVLARRAPEP